MVLRLRSQRRLFRRRRPLAGESRHHLAGEGTEVGDRGIGIDQQDIGRTAGLEFFQLGDHLVGHAEQRGGVVLDPVGQLVAGEVADHAQHALARRVGGSSLALVMDHLQRPSRRHHQRIVAPADPLAFLAEDRDALDDLVGLRQLVEQQIVALARGTPDAVVAAGGKPQRRVRALQGLGLDHDVLVVPALAMMAEAAPILVIGCRPRLADDLHRLVEPIGRLGDRDAEAVELGLAVAFAVAEVDAAAAQQVERRRLLGDQHRIVPRQHHHRGAEPDMTRARGEIGEHRHRRRHLALAGEVVLDHEQVLEAQPVGLGDVLDEALVALAVLEADTALGARAAEQAELHETSPNGWSMRHAARACPPSATFFAMRALQAVAYVNSVLQPGETIKVIGRLHWINYLKAFLLLAIAVILLLYGTHDMTKVQRTATYVGWLVLAVSVVMLLSSWFTRQMTELSVTNHRVIYKTGFLRRHTVEMNMDKVETVNVDQSILGRIFGYGTIHVLGTGQGIEGLSRIGRPIAVRNAITAR